MNLTAIKIRQAKPQDFPIVKQVMDEWWGRAISHLQHELFFAHFYNTAFIAEVDDGHMVGFINGFFSQTEPNTAYVHFIGIAPEARASGLGRLLYRRFFDVSRENGKRIVKACTSKGNVKSKDFHERIGFSVGASDPDKFHFEIEIN